jgi:hypothetical protein
MVNADHRTSLPWIQYSQKGAEVYFADSVEFEGVLIIRTVDGRIISGWKTEDSAENPTVLEANSWDFEQVVFNLNWMDQSVDSLELGCFSPEI